MEFTIKIKQADTIPSIDDFKSIMWYEKASISRVGNDSLFRRGEEISLSWDKWIDDPRWSNHVKSKEYIYFQFIRPNFFKIEIDDSAIFVDKRAAFLATRYLIEANDGEVSFDGVTWLQKNDFTEIYKPYLQCSFVDAVEESLVQ